MEAQKIPGKYEVKTSIIINTPSAAVWDVLKDFGNVSDWAPTVTKSYYLNSKTAGVGTGRHCDIKGFGGIKETVIDWQDGVGFTYEVTPLGPLDASVSKWKITQIDNQTSNLEVILKYDVRFGPFGKLLHKFVMRKKLEKALPETLVATKNHVESSYNTSSSTPELSVAI